MDITAGLLKDLNKDAPAGSLPTDDDTNKIDLQKPTPASDDTKDDTKDTGKDKKDTGKDKKSGK